MQYVHKLVSELLYIRFLFKKKKHLLQLVYKLEHTHTNYMKITFWNTVGEHI